MAAIRKLTFQEKKRLLRERELEIIFKRLGHARFQFGLELGSGSGFQGRLLVNRYVEKLVCTDLNEERLKQITHEGIEYRTVDAERLKGEFEEDTFDFVFASNLLEHLPDPKKCLSSIEKVLRDDGVFVCTVPTRLFVLLLILLYIPKKAHNIVVNREWSKICSYRKGTKESTKRNNLKAQPASGVNSIWRYIYPAPHGISSNLLAELVVFGKCHWLNHLNSSGLQLERIVKLPVYSPYLFSGARSLKSLLERIGLSSSYAFILKKVRVPLNKDMCLEKRGVGI